MQQRQLDSFTPQQMQCPPWLEYLIMGFVLGLLHFFVFFVWSLVFAARAPWVLHPFALLLVVAEGVLPLMTSYTGDWLQWPLILCNSYLYGLAGWWLVRRFGLRAAA